MTFLHLSKWNANSLQSHFLQPAAFPVTPLAGEEDDLDDDDFDWDEDEEDKFPGKDFDDFAEEDEDLDDDEDDDKEL